MFDFESAEIDPEPSGSLGSSDFVVGCCEVVGFILSVGLLVGVSLAVGLIVGDRGDVGTKNVGSGCGTVQTMDDPVTVPSHSNSSSSQRVSSSPVVPPPRLSGFVLKHISLPRQKRQFSFVTQPLQSPLKSGQGSPLIEGAADGLVVGSLVGGCVGLLVSLMTTVLDGGNPFSISKASKVPVSKLSLIVSSKTTKSSSSGPESVTVMRKHFVSGGGTIL